MDNTVTDNESIDIYGVEVKLENINIVLNTDKEQILKNIRYSSKLGIPDLDHGKELKKEWVCIVAGGPSLDDTWPALKNFDKIVACNGSHDYLIEKGIVPTDCVVVDANKRAAKFLNKPRKDVHYWLAAKCDPKTFAKVNNYKVTRVNEHINDLYEEGNGEPLLIGGGSTVPLRAINIFAVQGYRNFLFFGLDSCITDKVHAYECNHKYKNFTKIKCNGREFTCSPGMIHQANEVKDYIKHHGHFINMGFVGDGLISHMFRSQENGPIQSE